MKSKFLQFLLMFFVIFFVLQLFGIGKPVDKDNTEKNDIEITTQNSSYNLGDSIILNITNNLDTDITIENSCPEEPLDIYKYSNGEWNEITAKGVEIDNCSDIIVQSNTTYGINYGPWKNSIFSEKGDYKFVLSLLIDGKEKTFYKEIEVTEPGFMKSLWDKLFYKPIYNVLILFISVLPQTQNLGLSIILLTILIKLILLVPNNKAIKAQRDLQKVQPMLDAVKKKHAGDQQKIAEETMKIWKEHKVNPLGSCLPMLLQFPIMIALFYVIKNGLAVEQNIHLLYPFLQNISLSIDPIFLWCLDLTKRNIYVLPVIIGGLQFFQMKLSFMGTSNPNITSKTKNDQAQNVNKTMTYILPVMIAFFTASLPAAVGLYWGTSTLFAIIQQYLIQKKS